MTTNISLAPLLQSFFTDRLIRQKQVSSHTIGSYREYLPAAAAVPRETVEKDPFSDAVGRS